MKTRRSGQALMEFAVAVPLVFLLIVNVVNFGGLFYAWITVSHATRTGAQYMVQGPAYVQYGTANGLASIATPTAVKNLLTDCTDSPYGDMCSLPNQGNITVNVCSNDQSSGTATAETPETCTPPNNPSTSKAYEDPEPGFSVLGSVEVSYRYCPFIPFWEFPSLHIHSTLPSCGSGGTTGGTTVHRVAVMRVIQ